MDEDRVICKQRKAINCFFFIQTEALHEVSVVTAVSLLVSVVMIFLSPIIPAESQQSA